MMRVESADDVIDFCHDFIVLLHRLYIFFTTFLHLYFTELGSKFAELRKMETLQGEITYVVSEQRILVCILHQVPENLLEKRGENCENEFYRMACYSCFSDCFADRERDLFFCFCGARKQTGATQAEEFYDFGKDPDALYNLIDDPNYEKIIDQMSMELLEWMRETEDPALYAFENRHSPDVLKKFMMEQQTKADQSPKRKRIQNLTQND